MDARLTIGGKTFRSRLLVGTGKYPDNATMVRALEACGAEMMKYLVSNTRHFKGDENAVRIAPTAHVLKDKHIATLSKIASRC